MVLLFSRCFISLTQLILVCVFLSGVKKKNLKIEAHITKAELLFF